VTQARVNRPTESARKKKNSMALNLADETVDYSSDVDFFPFEVYGSFDLTILDYKESGEPGSDTNKGVKEFDLAMCRIDTSTNPAIRVGETYGFFFQTGGDGMSVKSRPFKIKALRAFIAAALGVEVKAIPMKDWPKKRTELLSNDYSGKTDRIHLKTKEGNKREDGTCYRDDVWSPATAV
jgi:hypothetical protein